MRTLVLQATQLSLALSHLRAIDRSLDFWSRSAAKKAKEKKKEKKKQKSGSEWIVHEIDRVRNAIDDSGAAQVSCNGFGGDNDNDNDD